MPLIRNLRTRRRRAVSLSDSAAAQKWHITNLMMNSLAKTHYWKHRNTETVWTVNEQNISATDSHSVMLQCWDLQCDAAVERCITWCYSTKTQCDAAIQGYNMILRSKDTHSVMLQYKDTQCDAAVQRYTMWCYSTRIHNVTLQYKDTICYWGQKTHSVMLQYKHI